MDPATFKRIFIASVVVLALAILDGQFAADEDVSNFLNTTASNFEDAYKLGLFYYDLLADCVLGLINGLEHGYATSANTLRGLANSTSVSCQGVYIDVMLLIESSLVKDFWQYIGSSFGLGGVERRVAQHSNPNYRLKHPRTHYIRMDAPHVKANFALLLGFPTPQSSGCVIFAEAVLANIFGAYQTNTHMSIRHRALPPVPRSSATNRGDPLLTTDWPKKYRAISDAKQVLLLTKVVDGGSYKVTNGHSGSKGNQIKYGFFLSSLRMHIPLATANLLNLSVGATIDARFMITAASSPTAWASAATSLDDASRLSIEVTHEGTSTWLHRDAALGIACSNAIFDWMTGKLSNIREMTESEWGSDRYPFFGPLKDKVSLASWNKTLVSEAARKAAADAGHPLISK